jgi:hypothetical protein
MPSRALLVLLGVVAVPSNALGADAQPATMALDSQRRRDVTIDLHPGAFVDGHGVGPYAGMSVIHRHGLVAGGVFGEGGLSWWSPFLPAYTYWGGGAAGGISVPTPRWLRVDVVGVLGVHQYSGVAPVVTGFSVVFPVVDSGASAVLPFAGVRPKVTFLAGPFAIGLEIFAEIDVLRATRSYELEAGFGGGRTTRTRTVGTERIGAALTFGATFDL